MQLPLSDLDKHVMTALGASATASRITHGELTLDVARDKIVDVLTYLRDDACCLFEVLIDICGVD
jgi:NADH-quinone oxidoreductase subunit C